MVAMSVNAQAMNLVPCWSCKGPVAVRALFCSVCGAVQGPNQVDHFTRLGLTQSFEVDMDVLERQYFGFQKRLHPDRFAAKSPKERALSQSQATALNEAYETLKSPLQRAAYLLSLSGRKINIWGNETISDPELLMDQMEKREALADADTLSQISDLAANADRDVLSVQCALSAAFVANELDRAESLTVRLKYALKTADEARAKKSRIARG